MPYVFWLFLQGFGTVLISVAGQWLVGLGVGFVAYTGVSSLISSSLAAVQLQAGSVPATALAVFHMLKVFTAFNLVCSAIAGKFAMSAAGSTGGALKRMVWK